MMIYDYIIIGAGIAGISALEQVRKFKPSAKVCLINGENFLPYKRTKINKSFSDPIDPSSYFLHESSWYSDIDLIQDELVASINRDKKTITTKNGTNLQYIKLLLTTGSKAQNFNIKLIHTIRSAQDVQEIQQLMHLANSVVVIGDGVLAVETAIQLKENNLSVTIIGKNQRLLEKQFSPEFSETLAIEMHNSGIKILFNNSVQTVLANGKNISISTNKTTLFSDMVIQATGIIPDTAINITPPLTERNGYLVNQYFQTSDPDIYSAGECADPENAEHAFIWHEAETQGITAGKNCTGFKNRWENTAFRLKCEVFGSYYFSMRPFSGKSEKYSDSEISQEWFLKDDHVSGVIMSGDKKRNKLYELAVREQWSIEKVNAQLSLRK